MMWKKFFRQLSLQESYLSLTLGFLVVVVSGILMYNFVTKQNVASRVAQIIPQIKMTQTTPDPQVLAQQQKAPDAAKVYTVQAGDTLWAIAETEYGTGFAWNQIAEANKLTSPGIIEIGQKLAIPKPPPVQGANPNILSTATDIPATHTVARGDSLWSISTKYYGNGYMWVTIARENNITEPGIIHNSNVLKLPHPGATLNTENGPDKTNLNAAVVQR